MINNFSRPQSPNQRESLNTLHSDAWFSYAKALSLFGAMRGLRVFTPMSGYNVAATALTDYSMNVQNAVVNNAAAIVTQRSLLECLSTPGDNTSFLEVADSAQVELDYPVLAIWAKHDDFLGKFRWLQSKYSAGAPDLSWAMGLNGLGNFVLYLSSNGTLQASFEVTTTHQVTNLTDWNFFAIQYRTTEINILLNDELFNFTVGVPAVVYGAGASNYRINWGVDGYSTLAIVADNNRSDVVSKLLGLYHHSKYAFRNDWGKSPHYFMDLFTGVDNTALIDHAPDITPLRVAWQEALPTSFRSGEITSNVYAFGGGVADETGAAIVDLNVSDNLLFSSLVTLEADEIGYIFRYQDESNYWLAILSTTIAAPAVCIAIVEVNAGVRTTRASTNGIAVTTQYRSELKIIGTSIDFTIGNAAGSFNCNFISASMQTETKHGVFIHRTGATSPSLDEFKIDPYMF